MDRGQELRSTVCFTLGGVDRKPIQASRVVELGDLEPGDESPIFPSPPTKTYGKSMGGSLWRKFFFLRAPWPQEGLAAVKIAAIEIEEEIQASEIKDLGKDIKTTVQEFHDGIKKELSTSPPEDLNKNTPYGVKNPQDESQQDAGSHETGEGTKISG